MKASDFISLKDAKFVYCGKHYTQKRYVSKDCRFFITMDACDYIRLFKGGKTGKAELIYEAYHQNNPYSYPIYSLNDALNKLTELDIRDAGQISVHESHYPKRMKPLVF